MERQVINRDRQELQAVDLNNMQHFTDQSLQHMIMDSITTERMIVGLTVTAHTATEIEVATGRLWDGTVGKVFRKDQAEQVSVFSHLPVADEKWLAVSVIGQEVDLDIQSRDFLVDLETGQTEPQAVAMERFRQVVVHVQPGLESAEPQKPVPPTGYTLTAYVRLNPSGIQEIELAENKKLMRLFDVWQLALANKAWINLADPKLATLISDLAQLSKMIRGLAYMDMIAELARDVALLKDRANLPDTFASYGADNFLDELESNTANDEYRARVDEGIRFPWAGQIVVPPDLFSQFTDEVVNFNGLILPAHTDVARLNATSDYAGGLPIAQYGFATQTMREGTRTKRRIRYGPTRIICTNSKGWASGQYDAAASVFKDASGNTYKTLERWGEHGGHVWVRLRQYWVDTFTETYWYLDTTDHHISGAQIAQTILNAQNGWLKSVDLYFSALGTDGDVHLHVCETDLGLPDPTRCVGRTTVAFSELKGELNPTKFTFQQPIFLEAGKRYALVITTLGTHSIATILGTKYTQGSLFQSTDGAFFQGDHTKDLMMRLIYAQFHNVRTTVELSPIGLSEGIADLDLLLEATIPESTDLIFEYQKEGSGEWFALIPETADQLLGLPAMLHLRAVFIGSQDLMPGLSLTGSTISANRPHDEFKHISTVRSLENASEDIDVILRLENWDETKHTCKVKLINGTDVYEAEPGSPTDTWITDADIPTIRRVVNFKPGAGAGGIATYQIQVEGTTTTPLNIFHVAQRMDVAK